MAVTAPDPIIHIFKEINPGKYRSVNHYELAEVIDGTSVLSEQINISKDRKFAKSNPDYWLKIKEGKKWSKPITGLFNTEYSGIYFGDRHFKKHLILAHFNNNGSEVNIYYYPNFYTKQFHNLIPVTVTN